MPVLNLWKNIKNDFLPLIKISWAGKSAVSGDISTGFQKTSGIFT
jgi:hypothetical protein